MEKTFHTGAAECEARERRRYDSAGIARDYVNAAGKESLFLMHRAKSFMKRCLRNVLTAMRCRRFTFFVREKVTASP